MAVRPWMNVKSFRFGGILLPTKQQGEDTPTMRSRELHKLHEFGIRNVTEIPLDNTFVYLTGLREILKYLTGGRIVLQEILFLSGHYLRV